MERKHEKKRKLFRKWHVLKVNLFTFMVKSRKISWVLSSVKNSWKFAFLKRRMADAIKSVIVAVNWLTIWAGTFLVKHVWWEWSLTRSCLALLYSSTILSMLLTSPSSDVHLRLKESFITKASRRRSTLKHAHSSGWKGNSIFNN